MESLVDELGVLKGEIAALELREKEIKAVLIESGQDLIKGIIFQAAISDSERVTLDSAKVRSFLSPVQIAACSRVSIVTTVRVSARSE
jgi:hypothetical protein